MVSLLLVAAGGCMLDALDRHDRSALVRACEPGHLEVVKLLLQHDAMVEHVVHKRVPFHDHTYTQTWQVAALTEASRRGHLAVVRTQL